MTTLNKHGCSHDHQQVCPSSCPCVGDLEWDHTVLVAMAFSCIAVRATCESPMSECLATVPRQSPWSEFLCHHSIFQYYPGGSRSWLLASNSKMAKAGAGCLLQTHGRIAGAGCLSYIHWRIAGADLHNLDDYPRQAWEPPGQPTSTPMILAMCGRSGVGPYRCCGDGIQLHSRQSSLSESLVSVPCQSFLVRVPDQSSCAIIHYSDTTPAEAGAGCLLQKHWRKQELAACFTNPGGSRSWLLAPETLAEAGAGCLLQLHWRIAGADLHNLDDYPKQAWMQPGQSTSMPIVMAMCGRSGVGPYRRCGDGIQLHSRQSPMSEFLARVPCQSPWSEFLVRVPCQSSCAIIHYSDTTPAEAGAGCLLQKHWRKQELAACFTNTGGSRSWLLASITLEDSRS